MESQRGIQIFSVLIETPMEYEVRNSKFLIVYILMNCSSLMCKITLLLCTTVRHLTTLEVV